MPLQWECRSLTTGSPGKSGGCGLDHDVFLHRWDEPWASLAAQRMKRLPAMQETRVRSLGWEDPLEKEMATHASTLAWRIPRTEEPGATIHGVAESDTTELLHFTSHCSPPGSSVHGASPGKNTGVGCHDLLQVIFPIQGANPGLLHCRRILYRLSHIKCLESVIKLSFRCTDI